MTNETKIVTLRFDTYRSTAFDTIGAVLIVQLTLDELSPHAHPSARGGAGGGGSGGDARWNELYVEPAVPARTCKKVNRRSCRYDVREENWKSVEGFMRAVRYQTPLLFMSNSAFIMVKYPITLIS